MFGSFYFAEGYFGEGSESVETVLSKNLTYWQPFNGKGYILDPGTAFFTDNSGNFLVDNHGNFLITSPSYVTGLNSTTWTASVKENTQWLPSNSKGYVMNPGNAFITDSNGNFLVDNSGNFLISTPEYVTGLNPTVWESVEAS